MQTYLNLNVVIENIMLQNIMLQPNAATRGVAVQWTRVILIIFYWEKSCSSIDTWALFRLQHFFLGKWCQKTKLIERSKILLPDSDHFSWSPKIVRCWWQFQNWWRWTLTWLMKDKIKQISQYIDKCNMRMDFYKFSFYTPNLYFCNGFFHIASIYWR